MDITKIVEDGDDPSWHVVPGTEGDNPVRICIKPMVPKRRREIVRACTKRVRIGGQLDSIVDDEKLNALILREVVVDWQNIEKDGELLKVTNENKELLDNNWAAFANLWNAVVGEQNRIDEVFEEARLGNS